MKRKTKTKNKNQPPKPKGKRTAAAAKLLRQVFPARVAERLAQTCLPLTDKQK